jgi:hypothetical protein
MPSRSCGGRRTRDALRFCDEFEHGFGWISDEFLARTSHALVAAGGVWLVDAVFWDEAERRIGGAGEPGGVIQLLDRHARDCAAVAQRLGVPHHVVPVGEVGPFEAIPVLERRWWRESALWWQDARVLVVADALGTIGYFTAGDERLGVHPLLRPKPPRSLARLEPLHVLCGHGEGVHGETAAQALREALRTARRRLPRAWLGSLRRRDPSRGTR